VRGKLRGRGGLHAVAYLLPAMEVLCAAALLGLANGARGQEATLVGDAHVSSVRTTVNAGSLSNLDVGGEYTALLQFDLSMLPAGVTSAAITRATLRVYCNRADTPGAVQVEPVDGAWTESSVTYATLPPLGATAQTAQVGAAGEFVTFDVTATVQGWVSAPATNFGLALAAAAGAQVQFDSKENDQTGHAPELEITLAAGGAGTVGPPGPAGAAGPVGPQGIPGPDGAAGPAGAIGPVGPQGIPGADGAVGATGAPGPIGPEGPAGAAGTNGSAGLQYQGAYDSTANYALGDVVVFQGSSYTSLVAFNVGQTPALSPEYWGLLTAQGPAGATGPAGAPGPVGPTGLLGPVGPPGEQGQTGAQGVAGQAGAQGIPGDTGVMGLQGPAGPQGVQGPVGLTFMGTYNSSTNYGLGDGVVWQNAGWVSLTAFNLGNTPSLSPSNWAIYAAAGTNGAQGLQGPPGTPGTNGIDGPPGPTGAPGPTGLTGAPGLPGLVYQGPYSSAANYALGDVVIWQGASWASLVDFNAGQTPGSAPAYWGVLTSVGPQGPVGAAGAIGPDGPPGQPGVVGPQGLQGSQGAAGPEGPAGAQGLTGPNGAVGPAGPQGSQGTPGQAGAQGIPGTTGATGLQGPAGVQGVQGPVGMSFQGPYDASANYGPGDGVSWQGSGWVSLTASNHGNTPSLSPTEWEMFSAPGAMGAQGPAGPLGPQGMSGVNGAPGVAGPTGATGMQGMQGEVGPPGPTGVAGPMGIQGPAGAQGLTGPTGATGSTGPQGSQGTPGQAGAQGIPGATGAMGLQGPGGPQGIQGVPGATGATGPAGAVGMNFVGAWNQTTHYSVNDAVTFAGSTYLAQAQNTNAEPDMFPGDWDVVAQAGEMGPAGAPGSAATVAVGTVTTLAAGSAATVTNSGTAEAAVLNFGIPQGAAGAPGSGGGSGNGAASGSFAAMYHGVSYNTLYYAANSPNASPSEASGAVLAWVPQACTASRLDVYSQQSGAITVTLRAGPPGSIADTVLACSAATNGSCSMTGSVLIAAGDFIDFRIDGASGSTAGVWTALQCQ
jgi:hypothetical protein